MKATLPKNESAERDLLGCLMIDDSADLLTKCREAGLRPDWFYDAKHQVIYAAMLTLTAAGNPIDEVTLCDALHRSGELAAAGGPSYIDELTRSVEVTAYAANRLELVREAHTRRRIIAQSRQLIEKAMNPAIPPEDALEAASCAIFDLSGAAQPVEDPAETLEKLSARFESIVAGAPDEERDDDRAVWGHAILDAKFRPLCARTGDFLVGIFGEAGTGKSSFVDGMLWANLAAGKVVVKHALETSNANTLASLAALRGGLPVNTSDDASAYRAHAGNNSEKLLRAAVDSQRSTYAALRGHLGKTLFLHDHTRDFGDIVTWTRRDAAIAERAGRKLDLVVVDYLQEIELNASERDRLRSDEVLDLIARRLKTLAKQLRCPVVIIASLNRTVNGGRPTMANIRGSGGIGFIIDRAVALYRPEERADGTPNKLTDNTPTVEVWVEQFNKRNVPAWAERMEFNGPNKRFRAIPAPAHAHSRAGHPQRQHANA